MNNKSLLVSLLLLTTSYSSHAIDIDVGVELQLLIDISGSVNTNEYNLQMDGYKAAFESDSVQDAIDGSEGIAVQLIMWSGATQQEVMIDWTLIDSDSSADSFAATIDTLVRPFSGWTAIGSAINFGVSEFDDNGFAGLKQVIDISGDGTNNSGPSPSGARDAALAAGIDTVNGIVITEDQAVLDQYTNDVVGGDSYFLLAPATFPDFQTAVETKIAAEILGTIPAGNVLTPIPEPSSIYLGLLSFFILYFNRTRFI
jgi:hypothetical protein